MLTRRDFGKLAGGAAAASMVGIKARAASIIPDMPANAIDVHNHVVGPVAKYPMAANRTYTPPEAPVPKLRELRAQMGVPRNVIVQPSFYGFDNRATMDAVKELGASARGVVVVPQTVSDAELKAYAAQGAVGARLNFSTLGISDPKAAIDQINGLAPRFAPLGWHIQINTNVPMIPDIAATVAGLRIPVVFDHMANLVAEKGLDQPGFRAFVELVKSSNVYVKLSAPYNLSKRPDWADVVPFAKALIAAAPMRMMWGTNWPHPAAQRAPLGTISPYQVVDNPKLLTALAQWCPDTALRKAILADTPAKLYRFA